MNASERQAKRFITTMLGVLVTLVLVIAGLLFVYQKTEADQARAMALGSNPGAQILVEALLDGDVNEAQQIALESITETQSFAPSVTRVAKDLPRIYETDCAQGLTGVEVITCSYGDPNGKYSVALVGDSKLEQYMDLFEDLASDLSWNLITFFKSGCAYSSADLAFESDDPDLVAKRISCEQWGDSVEEELMKIAPDTVVTSARQSVAPDPITGEESVEAMGEGFVERWKVLMDAGIGVAVVLDNPSPVGHVYECVAQNEQNPTGCVFETDEAITRSAAPAQQYATEKLPQVSTIDVRDGICPGDLCYPVLGKVLVYREGTHLSATYVKSMQELFNHRVLEALALD